MSGRHERVYRIMSGESRDANARALRTAARLGSVPYRAVVSARNTLFSSGLRTPVSLGRTTISIGNLTTGGTGKTPTVIDLVTRLLNDGHRPAILLRGYQATPSEHTKHRRTDKPDPPAPRHQSSDEARVYLQTFGDRVPVAADPSRVLSAAYLLHHHPEITCFVLDDAFQHRQVHRDLDLVLIDATRPFGYGHLLPRGLLREPRSALRRADAVIVTHADAVTRDQLAELDREIARIAGHPPLAHCAHVWSELQHDDETLPLASLSGLHVFGAAGIGNPDAFAAALGDAAAERVGFRAFDDHHLYTRPDLAELDRAAQDSGAEAIVTTDKDWVKWAPLLRDDPLRLPVYRPRLALQYLSGEAALHALVQKTVGTVSDSTPTTDR